MRPSTMRMVVPRFGMPLFFAIGDVANPNDVAGSRGKWRARTAQLAHFGNTLPRFRCFPGITVQSSGTTPGPPAQSRWLCGIGGLGGTTHPARPLGPHGLEASELPVGDTYVGS